MATKDSRRMPSLQEGVMATLATGKAGKDGTGGSNQVAIFVPEARPIRGVLIKKGWCKGADGYLRPHGETNATLEVTFDPIVIKKDSVYTPIDIVPSKIKAVIDEENSYRVSGHSKMVNFADYPYRYYPPAVAGQKVPQKYRYKSHPQLYTSIQRCVPLPGHPQYKASGIPNLDDPTPTEMVVTPAQSPEGPSEPEESFLEQVVEDFDPLDIVSVTSSEPSIQMGHASPSYMASREPAAESFDHMAQYREDTESSLSGLSERYQHLNLDTRYGHEKCTDTESSASTMSEPFRNVFEDVESEAEFQLASPVAYQSAPASLARTTYSPGGLLYRVTPESDEDLTYWPEA